ncbi:MAG: bifunctional riboflavin kinase/FAD synthetase [Eubacterium sp.]|nr:bifunctional riboflavin kinase/FAD synthetase [Eubacterium sp.]
MDYIKNIQQHITDVPSVVTLGKFDGVHEGHRLLMDEVLRRGRDDGLRTIVFTFDVSPQNRLGVSHTKSIMTNRERFLCLEELGIDTLIECPFTKDIQTMEAEVFVRKILLEKLHAAAIVVGDDFRFGRGRAGNAAFLSGMADKYRGAGDGLEFSVCVIGKKKDPVSGREISSTWIREEIQKGRMEEAEKLLGRPYFLLGEVVHGRQLGRTLQIPTINQIPPQEKLLPPNGVYFSSTQIGGRTWNGITNIGTKPTVAGDQVTAETHLFGCSADLYGKEASVELLHYHRPEHRFSSVTELKEHMEADIRAARDYMEKDAGDARSARDFLTVKL